MVELLLNWVVRWVFLRVRHAPAHADTLVVRLRSASIRRMRRWSDDRHERSSVFTLPGAALASQRFRLIRQSRGVRRPLDDAGRLLRIGPPGYCNNKAGRR